MHMHRDRRGRSALRLAMVAVVVAAWAGVVSGSAGASVEPEAKCQLVRTIYFNDAARTVFANNICVFPDGGGAILNHVSIMRAYIEPNGDLGPIDMVASGLGGVTYHCVGEDLALFSFWGHQVIANCT